MTTILAQANMENSSWAFTDDLTEGHTLSELVWMGVRDLKINVGFIGAESPVEFDGMSCTLVVRQDDVEIINAAYPNVPIERTDQAYCFGRNMNLVADSTVVITVSVTNAGETWMGTNTIVVAPLPAPEEPSE